ncbi:diacylglycerol/lipid kinase family protein [Salsuginibacillus kocurii]|uniref:diacylglycerol/lipid kinase family protein n=1 Tax=Salsuginibacillus kocurii TaxID=427078 RepID=UPI0003611727|nr:YegS/Rv2252/BmrU family lipid kinase [Salsuginibacillus kocurii]
MRKRALLIYNPYAGKKRVHKRFPLILEKLSSLGYDVTVHQLKPGCEKESSQWLQSACRAKWEAVFIAGGDGTINYTLQFIAGEDYRPAIGIFPLGTSNEFAQYIGAASIEQALEVIKNGTTTPMDIGQFGENYFANIASAGWLSDITYKTSSRLKSYVGELAYVLYFLRTFLLTKQSASISVNSSTDKKLSDLSLFLIMNGNSVGPFERLIMNSSRPDGAFHLITCKKTNRWKLFFALAAKLLQLSKHSSVIQHTKIRSGHFTLPEASPINLDGDKATASEFHFNVLPGHLRVFGTPER